VSAENAHAVQLVVEDDRRRNRLTVFFRLLLAIPHFIWFGLWSLGALLLALVIWVATLVRGIPPEGLHGFYAMYVRYSVHLGAYLTLAANPYPGFGGAAGSYPVDVVVPDPTEQRRWTVALRLVLAVPAIVLAAMLSPTVGGGGGGGAGRGQDAEAFAYQTGGALALVALLGWFASLATGRMPHGLRNFALYGLRYGAEALSYVFLLTGRYPNSEPTLRAEAGEPPERPIRLEVADDLRRSRLTVFFRFLLTLPHFVWLALWTVAAFFVALAAWFVALATGRVPSALHGFLAAYLRYATHVNAFLFLAANPFPGFTGTPRSYPVDLQIGPAERQRRLVTLFRFFLALPALLLESALGLLAFVAAFFGWFAALVTGRMPHGFRNVIAWDLRYAGQAGGYLLLLTDRYPYSGPPVEEAPPGPVVETESVAA
jgi:hypothetical protein